MDIALKIPVVIEGRSFCFTGRARKKRADMAAEVAANGGTFHPCVTRKTDYLVVGGKGNPKWKYGDFGNKVLRAACLMAKGHGIRIIQEEEFWRGIYGSF